MQKTIVSWDFFVKKSCSIILSMFMNKWYICWFRITDVYNKLIIHDTAHSAKKFKLTRDTYYQSGQSVCYHSVTNKNENWLQMHYSQNHRKWTCYSSSLTQNLLNNWWSRFETMHDVNVDSRCKFRAVSTKSVVGWCKCTCQAQIPIPLLDFAEYLIIV